MINNSANFIVRADRVCDYIPVVSSATNLVDLFQKVVVLPLMNPETIASSHYYTYLNDKSTLRCLILTVPVIGNILVALSDLDLIPRLSLGDYLMSRWISEKTGVSWNPDNKEIVLAAMRVNPAVVCFASERLRNDEDVALFAAQQIGWMALSSIGEKWRDNAEILEAIKAHPGFNTADYSEFLHDYLINHDNGNVSNAMRILRSKSSESSKLRNKMHDWLFAFALQEKNWNDAVDIISGWNYPCDSKKIMLLDGAPIQFASDRLKDDKEVVLAAVKRNKDAIKHASIRLQNDADVKHAAGLEKAAI